MHLSELPICNCLRYLDARTYATLWLLIVAQAMRFLVQDTTPCTRSRMLRAHDRREPPSPARMRPKNMSSIRRRRHCCRSGRPRRHVLRLFPRESGTAPDQRRLSRSAPVPHSFQRAPPRSLPRAAALRPRAPGAGAGGETGFATSGSVLLVVRLASVTRAARRNRASTTTPTPTRRQTPAHWWGAPRGGGDCVAKR